MIWFTALLFVLAHAIELTPETWDAATSGKTVFIKFYAPWCGHCKAMKPDWDQLMEKYENHDVVLVADVDCIGDGASICEEVGVEGFPTIKHGDPNNMEDYDGGRKFDDLDDFASKLKPVCSPALIDQCDEEQKKELNALLELSLEELQAKVDELQEQITEAESFFKAGVEELQATYEKLQADKDSEIDRIKADGYKTQKSVFGWRIGQGEKPPFDLMKELTRMGAQVQRSFLKLYNLVFQKIQELTGKDEL